MPHRTRRRPPSGRQPPAPGLAAAAAGVSAAWRSTY